MRQPDQLDQIVTTLAATMVTMRATRAAVAAAVHSEDCVRDGSGECRCSVVAHAFALVLERLARQAPPTFRDQNGNHG